jgi:hypothetical protein
MQIVGYSELRCQVSSEASPVACQPSDVSGNHHYHLHQRLYRCRQILVRSYTHTLSAKTPTNVMHREEYIFDSDGSSCSSLAHKVEYRYNPMIEDPGLLLRDLHSLLGSVARFVLEFATVLVY